mgnify:CR=1 FL=1|tara:strand:- start:199 stop:372 length:174 start_codon:yes stop_codon:yes gene_type:complete
MSEQELNKMQELMDYAVFSDSYSQTELAILYERYVECYKEFHKGDNDWLNQLINPFL